MSLILAGNVSETLAAWVDQNPSAHAAARRLLTRIARRPEAGVPASFVVRIEPEQLSSLDPSMRRFWQMIRQLPSHAQELIAAYPQLLFQREAIIPPIADEQRYILSFHVPGDIRVPRESRLQHATVLWLGTFS